MDLPLFSDPEFRDRLAPLSFYSVLAFLLMQPLLGSGYFITLDLQFGPSTYASHMFGDLYGLEPNAYGANLPLRLALSAISVLVSAEGLEKLILFSVLFLCGYLMHISLPKELGPARYFAGLLYMLNPFVFVRFIAGHWMLLLAYAFIPMCIRSFSEFIASPSDDRSLQKAALWTAMASFSIHGLLMLLIAYGCIFIHSLICCDHGGKSKKIIITRTALLAAIIVIVNLFWVLPPILLSQNDSSLAPASSYLEDFGARSDDMPLPLAILSMHGFWRGGFIYTKDIFSLWSIPFIAIMGLSIFGIYSLHKKKDPILVPLMVVCAFAVLLALGKDGPFEWVFSLFGGAVPLFVIFRDTQKFVALIALVYSILGAYGASHLLGFFREKTAVRIILLVAFLLIPVVFNYGFFGFIDQARLTQYPDDWVKAEEIISTDPSDTSILILPLHLYMELSWVNTSVGTIANPAPQFFSKPVIMADTIETRNIFADVKTMRTEYLNRLVMEGRAINNTAMLLLPINARYVIVMMDQPDATDSLYLLYGKKDIEFLFRGDNIMVFRNNLVEGRFFASDDDGSGGLDQLLNPEAGGQYPGDVEYEKITPALYQITGAEYPYIVFATPFAPAWSYPGSAVSSWHGIATAFGSGGPAYIENRVFLVVLPLLLLSWLICLMLLSGSKAIMAVPATIVAIVVGYLLSIGIFGPAVLGVFLISSALLALLLRKTDMSSNAKTGRSPSDAG